MRGIVYEPQRPMCWQSMQLQQASGGRMRELRDRPPSYRPGSRSLPAASPSGFISTESEGDRLCAAPSDMRQMDRFPIKPALAVPCTVAMTAESPAGRPRGHACCKSASP